MWQAADGAYCNQWVPGRDHLWSPLEPTVQGQFDRPQRQQARSVGTVATHARFARVGVHFRLPAASLGCRGLRGAVFCLASFPSMTSSCVAMGLVGMGGSSDHLLAFGPLGWPRVSWGARGGIASSFARAGTGVGVAPSSGLSGLLGLLP